MKTLRLVMGNPRLRLIAAALALFGAHNASVFPYQSLIAIERIGLSQAAFALVLILASVVAVAASVLFGLWGDQYGRRRAIALASGLSASLGVILMLVVPGKAAVVLAHGVLLPIASSLYGQFFALLRLAQPGPGAETDVVQANIRAAMSASFLAMLVFWSLVFGLGADVMAVYLSAAVACLGMSLLFYRRWPRDGDLPAGGRGAGLGLGAALGEILRPLILSRVMFLGVVASAGNMYVVVLSLIFDASPVRGAGDVALYMGLVAGWEVPAMLVLPRLIAPLPRARVLLVGAALYAGQLALLPALSDGPWIWAMPFVAGIGGAAIITLPIAYYQDLLRERPGAAAAMLAVQKLVADVATAAAFYLGTLLGGYAAAAVLGAAVSVAAAAGLVLADRRAWPAPRTGWKAA